MRRLLPLLFAATLLAGEAPPDRAALEARALAAVMALPDGEKREAGLRTLRAAYVRFREDCAAAAQPVPADATDERSARLAELAGRNAALVRLPAAADEVLAAHLARWPLDAEARLVLGRRRLDAGDRDGALDALLGVLALDPDGEAPRELRGRITLAGLAAAAEADRPALRRRAVGDLAPLIVRLLDAGTAAVVAGDAAGADAALAGLEPLAEAVLDEAGQGRLAALRADAAERAGRHPEALAQWERAAAAQVRTPDPAPRLRALVRRLEAERIAPALAADDVDLLRRLSPAFPERDDLQERLFRLLLTQGRLGDTLGAARALLAADPAHPLAQLLAEGCAAAADADRRELLPAFLIRLRVALAAIGGRFPVAHALNAALTETAGDAAGAAADLDPLVAARPDDLIWRWQRARLRLAARDHAGASADCEALLAARPDDADALALRGRARAAAGDRAGALADADRVVALRPGPAAHLARARVRHALADSAGTLADVAAVAAAAKDLRDAEALLDAADLARELGDVPAQRAVLETAARLGSADAHLRLKRLR